MSPSEAWGPLVVVYVAVYGAWTLQAFTATGNVGQGQPGAEVKSLCGAAGLAVLLACWKLGAPPGAAAMLAAALFAAPWAVILGRRLLKRFHSTEAH